MKNQLNFEENADEFIIKMMRKDGPKLKQQSYGLIEEGATLVFPKNYRFITELAKPHIERVVKLGWKADKTIFLEIPHIVTFMKDNFDPSLAQLWLIAVPPRKAYFRSVVFTKDYIASAHDIELEDTVIHEQMHLKEDEPKVRAGRLLAVDYGEVEERINKEVEEVLLKKYGSRYTSVKNSSGFSAFELQSQLKTLGSGFMEYWIHLYFYNRFETTLILRLLWTQMLMLLSI